MRIDAGKFKGRRLIEKKYDHIRPTTDKVRQALFVKLQFFVPEKTVLDLCCGTGALGIEALSRGAKSVIFVDKDARSAALTKSNLASLGDKSKVFKCDALKFVQTTDEKFDLILFDPPYKSGLYDKVLPIISQRGLLTANGILVCEHAYEDKFNYSMFEVFDEKKYGDTVLTYLSKGDNT